MEMADKILFTGMIDQYFDYCFGELEYRGLKFESETLDTNNYQGNAVINYTDAETPFTRIIEHKHFLDTNNYQGNAVINYTDAETPFTRIIEHKHFEIPSNELGTDKDSDKTIITREYPKQWEKGQEAYYPVNDEKNSALYEKYKEVAEKEENVTFGGRLGMYQYFDMWKVIEEALILVDEESI